MRTPSASSSALRPADKVGCVTPHASAARPKCRSRASARTNSSLSIRGQTSLGCHSALPFPQPIAVLTWRVARPTFDAPALTVLISSTPGPQDCSIPHCEVTAVLPNGNPGPDQAALRATGSGLDAVDRAPALVVDSLYGEPRSRNPVAAARGVWRPVRRIDQLADAGARSSPVSTRLMRARAPGPPIINADRLAICFGDFQRDAPSSFRCQTGAFDFGADLACALHRRS